MGHCVLTGFLLNFGSGWVFAQTPVKPGDTGTIEYPIENILPTYGPAEGVKIEARVEPAEFASQVTIDAAGSTLGPVDIAAKQTQTLVVKYNVGSGAPEGPFNIVLHVDMITVGATPDITDPANDPRLSFSIDTTAPAVSMGSSNGAVFSGSSTDGSGLVGNVDDCSGTAAVCSGSGGLSVYLGEPGPANSPICTYGPSDTGSYELTHCGGVELPEGEITVRGFDRAGNWTDFRFTINRSSAPPPSITDWFSSSTIRINPDKGEDIQWSGVGSLSASIVCGANSLCTSGHTPINGAFPSDTSFSVAPAGFGLTMTDRIQVSDGYDFAVTAYVAANISARSIVYAKADSGSRFELSATATYNVQWPDPTEIVDRGSGWSRCGRAFALTALGGGPHSIQSSTSCVVRRPDKAGWHL